MRTMFRTCLGLGILTMLAGPAMAQGRGGFGRVGVSGLLGNTGVQKELKLDDQQVEKAKELSEKIREEMREKLQALQDLEQDERRAKLTALSREMNASALKSAGEFLKPEQITRLRQIYLQRQGIAAFNDPAVARKLNLTDSQKSELRTIAREVMEKQPTREDFQDDREAAMKKVGALEKEALTKAESQLNDEQRKEWKDLIGPWFEWPPRD